MCKLFSIMRVEGLNLEVWRDEIPTAPTQEGSGFLDIFLQALGDFQGVDTPKRDGDDLPPYASYCIPCPLKQPLTDIPIGSLDATTESKSLNLETAHVFVQPKQGKQTYDEPIPIQPHENLVAHEEKDIWHHENASTTLPQEGSKGMALTKDLQIHVITPSVQSIPQGENTQQEHHGEDVFFQPSRKTSHISIPNPKHTAGSIKFVEEAFIDQKREQHSTVPPTTDFNLNTQTPSQVEKYVPIPQVSKIDTKASNKILQDEFSVKEHQTSSVPSGAGDKDISSMLLTPKDPQEKDMALSHPTKLWSSESAEEHEPKPNKHPDKPHADVQVHMRWEGTEDSVEKLQTVERTNRDYQPVDHKHVHIRLEDTEINIRVVRDSIKVGLETRNELAHNLSRETVKLAESLNTLGFRLETLQVNGHLVYSDAKGYERREDRNRQPNWSKPKNNREEPFQLSV